VCMAVEQHHLTPDRQLVPRCSLMFVRVSCRSKHWQVCSLCLSACCRTLSTHCLHWSSTQLMSCLWRQLKRN